MTYPTHDISSVALVFDGTIEGLMTAVFSAYELHVIPQDILSREHIQPRLGQDIIEITTNFSKAQRVRKSLCNRFGHDTWKFLSYVAASDKPDRGIVVYHYIRMALERAPYDIRQDRSDPLIHRAYLLERHSSTEAEHLRQFVRFSESEEGLWFALCSPHANVLPFVMPWFTQRFNTQDFLIYDTVHALAGISSGGLWKLVQTTSLETPTLCEEEYRMQRAWRGFYRSISIDERYHPELQHRQIPFRFWQHLTELACEPPYNQKRE